jgi:hypothetical protein
VSALVAQLPRAAGPAVAAPPAALESLIVGYFPPPLEEFRAKRFNLLWRGSRDCFGANEFRCRCDGRAYTLTLIRDTDGYVFGGVTPVKWESPVWNRKNGKESNGPSVTTASGVFSARSLLE